MRRFFLFFLFAAAAAFAQPQILLPRSGLTADELGLIVNDDDPLSRQIGEYYRQARRIPEGNVIRVRFAPGRAALPREEFERLRREIVRATPAPCARAPGAVRVARRGGAHGRLAAQR